MSKKLTSRLRDARLFASAVAALAVLVLSSGCGKDEKNSAAKQGAAQAAAPVTVGTVTALKQDVPVLVSSNAVLAAQKSVELHPQIVSTISKVHVSEGAFVRAGQLLFTLDDRTEQSNLAKANAQLLRDSATLQDLERQHRRSVELLAQNFVTQGAADTLQTQVQAQRALVQTDLAAIEAIKVNLSYSKIHAPMAGRLGAINVFPGSLVQVNTPLVTIAELDPISAVFTLPEQYLAPLLAAQQQAAIAVEAQLPGAGRTLRGKMHFIDNTVDSQSGMIKLKAQFDNRDKTLWPGQYLTLKVTVQTLPGAIVIPQAAIINNTRGTFVYTVGADQSALTQPVKVLHAFGLSAAVSGLQGGEKVIVDGKQNIRPGSKIKEAGNGAGNKADKAAQNPDKKPNNASAAASAAGK